MPKAKRGIYAAAISPFTEDGRLDTARLIAYCQHLMSPDGGCDGVAPTGTTGEGTSIPMGDRLALPGAFADAGIAKDSVIFGTGAPSTQDCIALSNAAVQAGYHNVLVLPPFYYKEPSEEGLYAYYSQLVEGIANDDLRIYLYHFPKMSAVPIPVNLVTRLRDAFGPIIAGLKDSTGDFEQSKAFIEATGGIAEGFDVYPATEVFLPRGLAIGSAGTISGTTNAFGKLARDIVNAPAGVEQDAAVERATATRDLAAQFSIMAAMKQIEAWRTGDDAWLRMAPPLQKLSPAEKDILQTGLSDLGMMPGA